LRRSAPWEIKKLTKFPVSSPTGWTFATDLG
jgi:hypothetical protein